MNAPLVFITGASSGIGEALAERFLRAGYRLALVARRGARLEAWAQDRMWADAVSAQPAKERQAAPVPAPADVSSARRIAVYPADVRDIAAITAAGRACIAEHGLPEIVIANAGISRGVDAAEFGDLDRMRATYETNSLGMAATFQPFIAAMRERGCGTLVGIASMAGIRGLPGHSAYCASKAAAISYCESLRGEMRDAGVKVVTLVPGYVDTPLTRRNPYPMPFLMTPDRFADRAFEAIVRGDRYRVIPWQMSIVATVMRALPDAWFDRLLVGRMRKPRAGD